jgi:hypothetical protein
MDIVYALSNPLEERLVQDVRGCARGGRVKVDCQMNQRDAEVPFAAAAEKISAIRRDFPSPPLNNVDLI